MLACPARLELTTPGLEGRCSIRLSYGHRFSESRDAINIKLWSGWTDSNRRHLAPKASALPGYATPRRRLFYALCRDWSIAIAQDIAAKLTILTNMKGGGGGGIRTHVPGYPDHLISSQRRYDRFGTPPADADYSIKMPRIHLTQRFHCADGAITDIPPIYGRNAAGTVRLPSAC
jgi:hypothetical protein